MSTTKTYKEKLQLLLNTKTQFKNDIINAGGTIDNSTPFSSYPAIYKTLKGGAPDGTAVEVTTEADMDALLVSSNVGKFYKYTGETTDKYTKDAYYVIQDSENPIVEECGGGSSANIVKPKIVSGITVPNDGSYIESISFNTDLTTNEVDSLIENNVTFIPALDNMYPIYSDTTGQFGCIIIPLSSISPSVGAEGYVIMIAEPEKELYCYVSPAGADMFGINGWNPSMPETIPVGIVCASTIVGASVGADNAKLTNLVTATAESATETEVVSTLSGDYLKKELEITENSGIDLTTYLDNKEIITDVKVNVPAPAINLQSKSVSPTRSSQTVTFDSGYDGLKQVSVNGVTRSIDSNIQAANIKKGISILGVTGTYEATGSLGTPTINDTTQAIPSVDTDALYICDVSSWAFCVANDINALDEDLDEALSADDGTYVVMGIFYIDYEFGYDSAYQDPGFGFRRLFYIVNSSPKSVVFIDLPHMEYEIGIDEETEERIYEYGYDGTPLFQGSFIKIFDIEDADGSGAFTVNEEALSIVSSFMKNIIFTKTTNTLEVRDAEGNIMEFPMGICNEILFNHCGIGCTKIISK